MCGFLGEDFRETKSAILDGGEQLQVRRATSQSETPLLVSDVGTASHWALSRTEYDQRA